jgi:hypothetical protein
MDSGMKKALPILVASPERWKSARKDGYLRDQNGKLQKPIMIIKRSSFTKNEQLITLNRYLDYTFVKKYSIKNVYDQFSVLNKKREEYPTHELYKITLPDHITVSYECVIWTDGIEQNNEVCEKFNFATDDYWGRKEGRRYRTEISDFSTQTEVTDDKERIVRTTFNLLVYAHLLPKEFENGQNVVKKELSPRKVVITEHVDYPPKVASPRTDQIFIDPNKNSKLKIKTDTINFTDR